jgi:eukaryotic-like serine/threonine-protein kinase
MSDETLAPPKPTADGAAGPRGGNGAAPDETRPQAADATLLSSPPVSGHTGNIDTTIAVAGEPAPPAPGDVTIAAPADVTLGRSTDGVTLISPAFENTLGGVTGDGTLNSTPSDVTMGGLDGATAAFHQKALEAAPKPITKGASFGHYELLEPIAKGGMGIVYKARQRSLNRIVAIKMILAGQFADEDDVGRFYAEAEAAAALSHPNIVAIHEIGEVSGQHFFSMDYIEGQSLSGLIAENPVPPRRAAELMITISETMEFAHENGVVHRDLKPANVLLDKRQRPLITDFGLAKQVNTSQSQRTMAGSIVGTPSYMPPEQAAGRLDQVGAWSDLYSLGAILYELITGRPPFRASSPFETIRQVLETEPPSPRVLNPSVPKDLETICVKCLQKERTRRYGSAQELADELKRFLRGEPIQARPISQVARFWRLCKRYPITSSAIATAVVFFIAASVILAVAYVRTAAALAQAEASFVEQNEVIDTFLTTVGEKTLANLPGGQKVQKQLLDDALVYNERFLKQRGNDPRVANEVARSLYRVAKISMTLGRYDEALEPLNAAKAMQEPLLAKNPNDLKKLRALGDTLTELGQIWVRKNDYDAASALYIEAAKIRGRLAAAASDSLPEKPEYQRLHANAHMNAGLVAFKRAQANPQETEAAEQLREARRQYQEAQKIRLSLLQADPQNLKVRRDLGKGYFNLGILARVELDIEEEIKSYQDAATAFEEVLALDPADLENQGLLTTSRRFVGALLKNEGRPAEARGWYEKGLDRLSTLVKQNPDVPEYQAQQAALLLNLFELEKEAGNTSQALAALQRAQRNYARLVEEYKSVSMYRRDLALTLRELAKEEHAGGDAKAAAKDLQESLRLLNELVQQYPDEVQFADDLKETQAVMLSGTANAN